MIMQSCWCPRCTEWTRIMGKFDCGQINAAMRDVLLAMLPDRVEHEPVPRPKDNSK